MPTKLPQTPADFDGIALLNAPKTWLSSLTTVNFIDAAASNANNASEMLGRVGQTYELAEGVQGKLFLGEKVNGVITLFDSREGFNPVTNNETNHLGNSHALSMQYNTADGASGNNSIRSKSAIDFYMAVTDSSVLDENGMLPDAISMETVYDFLSV